MELPSCPHLQQVSSRPGFEVLSLDQFVETEDTIFFEATVRTAMGQVKVYDAFVLSDGKATHHFTGVK
jgi:hypothetical protein